MADKKDTTTVTTKTTTEEIQGEGTKTNWADVDEDDHDEDDDQEIGVKGKPQKKEKIVAPKEEIKVEKKDFGPPETREKTVRGDYVVTKFVIPDRVV
jgi:hypothetical protein